MDIKQTSSLVRIREGTTAIIGGLIQNLRHKTEHKVPILGEVHSYYNDEGSRIFDKNFR